MSFRKHKGFEPEYNRPQGNTEKPEDEGLEKILNELGYAYDEEQDIFFSIKDAWQRDYGYCSLYDNAAPMMNLIYDCEPIYFEYDDKRWLIELWKGQYGITTGCELGVYTADMPDLPIISDFPKYTFYKAASDKDCLPMSIALRKKDGASIDSDFGRKRGKALFRRNGTHWWLTGFVLGEFTQPKDLEMDVKITLKDRDMRDTFVGKLDERGFTDIEVNGNTVGFTFIKPYAKQPLTRRLLKPLSQTSNKLFTGIFKRYTKNAVNIIEAIEYVRHKSPFLFKLAMNIGKPARFFIDNKKAADAKIILENLDNRR